MKITIYLFLLFLLLFNLNKLEAQVTQLVGTNKRPNILLIMTDQQTAKTIRALGNRDVKTPYMDYLVEHGITYSRAYCAQPLCTPSRVSILTGHYPHQTGVTVNGSEHSGLRIPDSTKIIGKVLSENGYRTLYVGKWHIPIAWEDTAKHGFQTSLNIATQDFSDAASPADFTNYIKATDTTPFFAVVSLLNPHDINEWARNDFLKMDILPDFSDSDLLPQLPANFAIPEDEPEVVRSQQLSNFKTYPTRDWDSLQWRKYRWSYNRLVENVDHVIGMIETGLRKYNKLDNTIILFTSDHGEGYAAHRWNQKQVLYEESINVPFVISNPKIKPSVDSSSLLNTGLTIFPAITYLAGINNNFPDASKLFKLQNSLNKTSIVKDTVVIETEFADNNKSLGINGRAVITKDFKYILYDKGNAREQLFNLKEDSGELHSLVRYPRYKNILLAFRNYLKRWAIASHDVKFSH